MWRCRNDVRGGARRLVFCVRRGRTLDGLSVVCPVAGGSRCLWGCVVAMGLSGELDR